jgi:HAD superfamily hydrolase (TIGR01509 family)
MPAILLGSISTVADTSEMQREAFNRAFAEHGLGWSWDRQQYRELLQESGGRERIAAVARQQGVEVDAGAVHRTKTERFHELLAGTALHPRPGVAATLRAAHEQDLPVALVTTTDPENVRVLLDSLSDEVDPSVFATIIDATQVSRPKPDPEAYRLALSRLGVEASSCVAVEDNLGGLRSAADAGITCLAFPNDNTAGHDFGTAPVVTELHLDELRKAIPSAA